MLLLFGFIFAQIILLGIIIFVLKRLIFQDTTSAVNRLTRLDNMNREKEKQLVARLEEVEKMLAAKRAELEEEEKRMKMEAQRAANQLHDEIIKTARQEADELIKKATSSRDKMKADCMIEAENKVVDFCLEMMKKALSSLVIDSIDDELVAEFITNLEATDMRVISDTISEVEVDSARKITPDLAQKIQDELNKKLGREIKLKFREDAALLGGVLLRFGSLVVDDTLVEHLREAAKQLKEGVSWAHKV